MKFCEICGNRLIRQPNGSLMCSNGHIIEDEGTRERRKAKVQRKKELRRRAITFPNVEKVQVFRLIHPYIERQKTGLTPNAPSFPFYAFLRELTSRYSPNDFRYIAGNPWAVGSIEHKYGLIFIRNELVIEIKSKIEGYMLSDSSNFTLELLELDIQEKRAIIKHEKEKMKRKFWKKHLNM